MGLIKAAIETIGAFGNAIGNTLSSSWVDYFESGDMTGILMKRGVKIASKGSKNKSGDENIITSGSGIDVQVNQCMILVENGRIVDFCAEPGRYTFDSSTAPSLMSGNNKGLKALASSIGGQFLAGGSRTATQRVFYIKPSGEFNRAHVTQIAGMPYDLMKTEAIAAIRQGVGQLSKLHIAYTDIAANEMQLTEDVNAILTQSWNEARGIGIFKIAIGMMDADDVSKEKIAKYQETKGYTDPSMLGAYMGMGQTQAMQAAGANANGAVTGFAGLGMMGGMANGANIAGLMQQGQMQQAQMQQAQMQQAQMQQAQPQAPQGATWTCSCGSVNTGKFCPNCGAQKPAQAANACPNCGYIIPDPSNPPKFCPECGTKL